MRRKRSGISRSRLAGAYISAVISIALVLVLVGVSSLLLVNSGKVADFFKESLQMTVFLKQEVSDEAGKEFYEKLKTRSFVHEARLVSRKQGEDELKELLGEDFLDVFESVPVPVSVDLNLKAEYVHPDSIAKVKAVLEKDPAVDEVEGRKVLMDAVSSNMTKVTLVMAALMALLLFVSFILITNVVRLLLYSKRYAVNTMQLVGASRGFIMRPFLGAAAVQGVIASVFALAVLFGLLAFVRSNVPQLFDIITGEALLIVAGTVFAFGLLICVGSTFFVIRRLLSLSKDELYG